jgi:hypothetical protein
MKSAEWKTYRTRFLVKAKQLNSSLSFIDHLGRQHCGRKGDYLVESADGVISIAPRKIFEDIYVLMFSSNEHDFSDQQIAEETIAPQFDRRPVESLNIKRIKFQTPGARPPVEDPRGIPQRPVQQKAIAAQPDLARHEEATRVRRKLPQPCRDGHPLPSRLSLM